MRRIVGYTNDGRPLASPTKIHIAETAILDPVYCAHETIKYAIRVIEEDGAYDEDGRRITAEILLQASAISGLWIYIENQGYGERNTFMIGSYLRCVRGVEYAKFEDRVTQFCIPVLDAMLKIYPGHCEVA